MTVALGLTARALPATDIVRLQACSETLGELLHSQSGEWVRFGAALGLGLMAPQLCSSGRLATAMHGVNFGSPVDGDKAKGPRKATVAPVVTLVDALSVIVVPATGSSQAPLGARWGAAVALGLAAYAIASASNEVSGGMAAVQRAHSAQHEITQPVMTPATWSTVGADGDRLAGPALLAQAMMLSCELRAGTRSGADVKQFVASVMPIMQQAATLPTCAEAVCCSLGFVLDEMQVNTHMTVLCAACCLLHNTPMCLTHSRHVSLSA